MSYTEYSSSGGISPTRHPTFLRLKVKTKKQIL
jgi:hypothetical protein